MSQDLGNDLHVMSCESSCKRLRICDAKNRNTGMLHKDLLGATKGTSHNAKRSNRVPGCSFGFQERPQESVQGPECTTDVQDDVSEHIKQVDETHKKRMLELTQKQKMEILQYFRTKQERKEPLNKMYQLKKDLIRERSGESWSKTEKLAQLDEELQIKLEGLRHEMDKYWENMRASHLTARTNEEEMRLKRIELLKKCNIDAPSTSIDSGNPNTSPLHSTLLESESAINTLEDGEIYTSPTVIYSPLPSLKDFSPRERLNMANDNGLSHDVETSPENFPMGDLIAEPVDTDKQMHNSSVPVILGEPVISSTSSNENELESAINTLEEGEIYMPPLQDFSLRERLNMANDDGLSHDVEIYPNNLPMDALIATPVDPDKQMHRSTVPVIFGEPVISSTSSTLLPTKEITVVIGSDDEQIYFSSVSVPVDGSTFLISSPIKHLDVLAVPVTPDNRNRSNCLPPLLESSLGADVSKKNQNHAPQNAVSCSLPITESESPSNDMLSSEELAVPSDTIEVLSDSSCKETSIIYLDSDDEQIHEISDATPVDVINMSDEIPGTSSEQRNHFSVGCSRIEQAACFSSMENQDIEAQRMMGRISNGGSSSCRALPGGGQGSMNQDTVARELRQEIQGNTRADSRSSRLTEAASFSLPQQLCTDQSRQLPLEQLPPTQLPWSEIRVIDESLPWPSCQYVGNGACSQLLQSSTRASMRPDISQPQLYDTTSNYYINSSRNPYVRPNSSHPRSLDPLQVELEKIDKEGNAAMKMHENMVVQLGVARDKEMAQIFQKYAFLFEDAKKDIMQKREELSLHYEKTKAHKLLAEAWALANVETSPMFHPSAMVQSTSPQLVNQFSADQIIRQPNPHLHQILCNPEAGRGPYVPNPHLYSSFPTTANPLHGFHPSQPNWHPLNFCSSGSSTGSYSHFHSPGEYPAPYNIHI